MARQRDAHVGRVHVEVERDAPSSACRRCRRCSRSPDRSPARACASPPCRCRSIDADPDAVAFIAPTCRTSPAAPASTGMHSPRSRRRAARSSSRARPSSPASRRCRYMQALVPGVDGTQSGALNYALLDRAGRAGDAQRRAVLVARCLAGVDEARAVDVGERRRAREHVRAASLAGAPVKSITSRGRRRRRSSCRSSGSKLAASREPADLAGVAAGVAARDERAAGSACRRPRHVGDEPSARSCVMSVPAHDGGAGAAGVDLLDPDAALVARRAARHRARGARRLAERDVDRARSRRA